jgi:hypothetical protein
VCEEREQKKMKAKSSDVKDYIANVKFLWNYHDRYKSPEKEYSVRYYKALGC